VCGAVYSVWCCVQCVVLCTVCGAVYSVWCCVQCVGVCTVSFGFVLDLKSNCKKSFQIVVTKKVCCLYDLIT